MVNKKIHQLAKIIIHNIRETARRAAGRAGWGAAAAVAAATAVSY